MSVHEQIQAFLAKNNNIITTTDVHSIGIQTKVLQRMVEKGQLERLTRGLYMDPSSIEDPFLIAQYRCPNGIFSMDTALFLHQMTDRNPIHLCMTIPSGYNSLLLTQKGYQFFYLKKKHWQFGQEPVLTPYGNTVIVYDLERTICDCIRKMDELDRSEVITAIKTYMKRQDKDAQKLLSYADVFHIREQVWKYMEVLL